MADIAQSDVIIVVILHKCGTDRDGIARHGEGTVAAHRDSGARTTCFKHRISANHITRFRCGCDGDRSTFHGTLWSRHTTMGQTCSASDIIVHSALPVFVPNHVGIFRMVNERIAVILIAIDSVVTSNFLVTHRVFIAPTQQHSHGPRKNL